MKAMTRSIGYSATDLRIDSTSLTRNRRERLLTTWNKIWQSFITTIAGSSEPRIWQVCDRSGQIIWHVHDPATGYSATFASEAEVRMWIDQRYYA